MMHQRRQSSDIEDIGGQPKVGVIKKRQWNVTLISVSGEGGELL
jgi:hypothetical protein